jgi:hypothetical protein
MVGASNSLVTMQMIEGSDESNGLSSCYSRFSSSSSTYNAQNTKEF